PTVTQELLQKFIPGGSSGSSSSGSSNLVFAAYCLGCKFQILPPTPASSSAAGHHL
ncbi:unnamed protein product, partial [Ceratitis capitata]